MYRGCSSDDDLSALNAFFFTRIASLTSWFHQDVLFSLSPASLNRFRQQLSAADEMIADLNRSHPFSMSSDASGSCLSLDDILNARSSDPIHLHENYLPEITFPRKTLGRNYINPNVQFPDRALARNYISLNVHLEEFTFSKTCTSRNLHLAEITLPKTYFPEIVHISPKFHY